MNIRQHLRLYLDGRSDASTLALSKVRQMCNDHLRNRYSLDVIDLERRPQLARLDHIVVVPTLVRWFPGPIIKITGNRWEPQRILTSIEDQKPDPLGRQMHSVLKYLLLGGIQKTAANMGTVQLLDKGSGMLRINAQVQFERKFLDYFRYMSQEQSACGAALATRRRVVVEDITLSPIFFGPEPLAAMLDAGVRALHCAPLRTSLGDNLGVVTMYYQKPTRPLDRDRYALTKLAHSMADYLQDLNSLLYRSSLRVIK